MFEYITNLSQHFTYQGLKEQIKKPIKITQPTLGVE